MRKLSLIFSILIFISSASAQDTTEIVEPVIVDTIEYEPVIVTDEVVPDRFDKVEASGITLTPRQADPEVMKEIKGDKDFAYVVKTPKKKKKEEATDDWLTRFAKQKWLKPLMWVIVILAFLSILIAFLTKSNISLFRKEPKKMEAAEVPEESDGNIFEINYEADIPKAIDKGNYHLAIRLLYLQLLKNMASRNLIDYRQERTNGDYVFQLFNTPYYKPFFSLTRNYEYVWYGKFPVSLTAFQTMHNEFREFNRRLSA